MKLNKIVLENIRSYRNQEIEFPVGSTLLSGDIGSGKTSVLLGIEFALFGLQPGQKGSSLLRNGETFGGVAIEFEIDEKKIIVERKLKRGKSISQEECFLTVNGERRETSVTELKNYVLNLLNYPQEFSRKQNLLYKFTVYTPQEEMKQIILEDPETRINTLRQIFGIDKYKKILENTSLLSGKIREEKRLNESMISTLDSDRALLASRESELESKNRNLYSVEKELFAKTEQRKKLQEEKDGISKKINEKVAMMQEAEKLKLMASGKNELILSNRKLSEQINSQIRELQSMNFDELLILKLDGDLKMKKREKNGINDTLIKISSKINSIVLKNQENAEIKNKISNIEICPTCLQEVNVLYKNNILGKLNADVFENLKKMETMSLEKRELERSASKIDSETTEIERQIREYNILKIKVQDLGEKKARVLEFESLNANLEAEIAVLRAKISSVESSILDLSKFDSAFEEKQGLFDEALRQERFAEIRIAELKKEIEFFSGQIGELKARIQKLDEMKKRMHYLSEIENWLSLKFSPLISTIEKNVMTKLKKEFSNLFSEWFLMLVSDSFNVSLDDNFTPIIEQQDYELDYSYLSGGERTAIALAYRLALNQVINSLLSKIKTKDLVVLDEPTDGFSSQQLDKMRDVLNQLNVKQLIIVSHEQKIESFVQNIVRFRKVGGVSERE